MNLYLKLYMKLYTFGFDDFSLHLIQSSLTSMTFWDCRASLKGYLLPPGKKTLGFQQYPCSKFAGMQFSGMKKPLQDAACSRMACKHKKIQNKKQKYDWAHAENLRERYFLLGKKSLRDAASSPRACKIGFRQNPLPNQGN